MKYGFSNAITVAFSVDKVTDFFEVRARQNIFEGREEIVGRTLNRVVGLEVVDEFFGLHGKADSPEYYRGARFLPQ